MEQSHRYLASVVTVLVIVVTILVWRSGPIAHHLRWTSGLGVTAIAVQIILGAITVLTKNAPWTVAAHLLFAMLFVGIITLNMVGSFRGSGPAPTRWCHLSLPTSAAIGALYLILISGSLVVNGGAQATCRSWLVCANSRAAGGLVALQLIHRGVILVSGTYLVYFLFSVRSRVRRDQRRVLATLALGLLAIQVIVGMVNSALGAPAGVADTHLALATALWIILVSIAALESLASHVPSPCDELTTAFEHAGKLRSSNDE